MAVDLKGLMNNNLWEKPVEFFNTNLEFARRARQVMTDVADVATSEIATLDSKYTIAIEIE